MFAFSIRLSSCMTLSSVYVVASSVLVFFLTFAKIALIFPNGLKFIHFCKQNDSPGE